jgi:hypothetical protein
MSGGQIVPPALTPAQWQDAVTHGYQHDVPPLEAGSPPELLHYSMAMANALLPSGDPRKLTQADVTALWLVAHQLSGTIGGATCAAIAAKLAALLPPVEPEEEGRRG